MEGCPHLLDTLVNNTNFTWGEALQNKIPSIKSVDYLRPDDGTSLMPWIYTAIVFVVHLPMVLVRVTRWEIVQVWSIVFTAFTVIIYIQAYVSTGFDPAKILLWTPLILVIDAGSMAQVFFLVIEAKQNFVGSRVVLSESQGQEASSLHSRFRVWWWRRTGQKTRSLSIVDSRMENGELEELQPNGTAVAPDVNTPAPAPTAKSTNAGSSPSNSPNRKHAKKLRLYKDPAILSASTAAILFFAVLIIQIIGLAEAAKAARSLEEPPTVSWCSPLFQPFGLAAVDSNCKVYDITRSGNRGIGCLEIPGMWQQQWIQGTVAGTSIELICELIDVLILALVSKNRRVRGAKLKRPWATIFSGITVLGVTLLFGVEYSKRLPQEIASRVTIAMSVPDPTSYTGILSAAGLRGTIIAWNDGLFESWGNVFFGDS